MNRPEHRGLRHLALNVSDMDRMTRFYVDVLGFAIEWQPDRDNVYLSSGVDNLALHHSASLAAARSAAGTARSPLDHFGLLVRSAGDVDLWAAFLESHGVAIDEKPRTHRDGARSCYFSDPEGNRIQIIHHPPIADV